jgi:hypothetical protein
MLVNPLRTHTLDHTGACGLGLIWYLMRGHALRKSGYNSGSRLQYAGS